MAERTPAQWMEVLDRLLDGDRVAFLEFNRLLTAILTRCRAYDFREDWDDLRQEVLMSVVANARAGRLRDPEKFVAYVRGITRNKFVDRLKTRLRHHEKQTLPWDDETAAMAEPPAGGESDTEDVWDAVRRLPPEQQRMLQGLYREGKTYEQVAADTGIPLGTMKRWLRGAIEDLRGRLGARVDPISPRRQTLSKGTEKA